MGVALLVRRARVLTGTACFFLCAALALFAALPAKAQLSARQTASEVGATALRDRALADNVAYSIVEELTTRFGARPAGSIAERRSAEWMAERMRQLGLANVRLEEFPITVWQRNREQGEIVAPFPQSLALTALGGSPPTPASGISGEVVIFDSLESLTNAAPGSLTGKIAMLNFRMPRTQSGLGYNFATAGRGQGPGLAAARGAVAFIMRPAGTDTDRTPHTGSTRYENGRVPIPAFSLSTRDANQIERLAARGRVRVRLFSQASSQPGRSQNVLAEIRGREKPDEIVLIGAHIDSWDLGTGAVDDASGIGIVTAAAALIAAMPQPPRRTIRVVLFGAEEQSQPGDPAFIAGAFAYARAHEVEIPSYVVASESDLGADRIYGLDLPEGFAASEFGTQVARVVRPLGIIVEAEVPPHGGADFLPLLGRVPVFLMKQDAARYFDIHHTDHDTIEEVDKAALDQNVAAWAALLWLIAEGDIDFRQSPPTTRQ